MGQTPAEHASRSQDTDLLNRLAGGDKLVVVVVDERLALPIQLADLAEKLRLVLEQLRERVRWV